ncbi:MAG: PAS domain-containing protein, partial [Deltaproteobacteria bacterium]|nr:PAS domain-containing protein [Deltaproteobacteria bacterium]
MAGKPTYEELKQRVKELEMAAIAQRHTGENPDLVAMAVEQSSEGIVIVTLEGEQLYLNDAFARMHGYSKEELIGKNISFFHTPEQMPSVEAANNELKQQGVFKGELWHARRDGTAFPTMMNNSVVKNDKGTPIAMVGTFRDISDLKRTAEGLKSLGEELEERVAQRTFELKHIQERL